jgi:hypothetical protein
MSKRHQRSPERPWRPSRWRPWHKRTTRFHPSGRACRAACAASCPDRRRRRGRLKRAASQPEESQGIDPYEAVLADLYAKREQIDAAIAAIESLRHGTASGIPRSPAAAANNGGKANPAGNADGPGALLGMSISDAAEKLLASKRTTLKNNDIATLFKAGGLMLNSKDWVNTIGAVLTRRANEVGDIVKVERGTWGWYPNRSFNKEKEEAKGEEAETKEVPVKPPAPPY